MSRSPSILALAFALTNCQHRDPAPTATESASSSVAPSASVYVETTRAQHFDTEMLRARELWQAKPNLGDCSVLHEKADLELCQGAARALSALAQQPEAPAERALPLLTDGALALARLSERVRYLSLSELSQKRLSGKKERPAPSASGAVPERNARAAHEHSEPRVLELSEGPISELMSSTVRLERAVLRNLGAYLEYAAALAVRRSAFQAVKQLRNEHPQWPLLDHLIQEAALLESDRELKRELREFSAAGLPRGTRPGQSTDSK